VTHEKICSRTNEVDAKVLRPQTLKSESLEKLGRLRLGSNEMLDDCFSYKKIPLVELALDARWNTRFGVFSEKHDFKDTFALLKLC
jgi:hypothetical protein